MVKIIIGVIIVATIVIAGFMILDPNINSGIVVNTSEVISTASFTATIEGEVENEGTYTLAEGSTLGDLITKAGGATSNADQRAYYESIVLEKGSSYYIAGIYSATDICNQDALKKVNINSDEAETLATVDGISASIASSIVSYRISDGGFETIEELTKVYGIGNATYKKIRNYVILHE